jgi:hypothetical protein
MYRIEDIEKINKNIDKIKDDAAKEYKTLYEPTLNEISKIYTSIKDYIKRKGRVAYGGFAQNLLIMKNNPDDSFYKIIDGVFYNWPDLADIEFYTSTPIEDVIELTEELLSKGYKNVEGKEGIHSDTYKIFVNFLNYCDISYIPTNVNNNIPIIEVDGIKCAHPHFMMVDTYRILTDPMTSYWRVDKSIKRFQKLIKYYPFDQTKANMKIELKSNDQSIIKLIRKKIVQKTKLIVVGFAAYNYYAKKESESNILKNIPFYELISTNFVRDAKNIMKFFNKRFPGKVTTKEYYPFYTFMDKKIEYYINNQLVLRLFGNNERCIVYNFSDKKKTHFGTFNLVMMYIYFNYFYYYVNRDKYNTELFLGLITKFYNLRNKYLDHHNLTVIDKSPFQDFTFKCYGIPTDPIRSSLLEGLEKKKQGKRMKFRYDPSGKSGKVPEFSFPNISGNQILNEKYFILKKNNL